jgi:two-component system chemotaxis response regulator CheY
MVKKVLVVDDSDSMRQLITFTLKGAGYEVIEAIDGREGIKQLTGSGIDMVITDLNMPNMDGIEFLKELRSNQTFKFLPVVMLTTESQVSKVMEAKAAGISGWIIKPFTPEQLIDTVAKFVGAGVQ